MTIDSVNLTRALSNQAYAQQVIRSGKCSPEQEELIRDKYDPNNTGLLDKWKSVDATQYVFTDENGEVKDRNLDARKDAARAKGDEKVDEATKGFDGKSDGVKSAAGATANVVGAAGGVFSTIASLSGLLTKCTSALIAAISGAVLLASAILLKVTAPNKEQAQACDDLVPVMEESRKELDEQQSVLSETTNDIVKKTDDMTKASEDANKKTETDQKNYEKLQARYQELAAKQEAAKNGGEPLTDSEKAEFQQLSGELGTAFENLQNIKVEGDKALDEAKKELDEKLDVYDEATMKMEEVQEITDFSAEFDQATVDNAGMVKDTANIGKYGAYGAIAAGVLGWGKSIFHPDFWAAPVAVATGVASRIAFESVIKDQDDFKARAEAGVENRTVTAAFNVDTNDVYEEEFDNYVSNIDLMNEIEYTETTATETQVVALSQTPTEDDAGTPSPAGNEPEVNPFAPPTANDSSAGAGGVDNDSNPFGGKVDKDKEV